MRIAVVATVWLLGCGEFLGLGDFDDAPPGVGGGGQSASSSSTGGQASSSSSGGGGTPAQCPPVMFGPQLVAVDGYCMDVTEVTEGQYRAWLDTDPPTSGQPPFCSQNIAFWDLAIDEPPRGSKLPVVRVDWCDALAFCVAAGKRLCGGVRGKLLDYVVSGPIDSLESEWHLACTNQGTTTFPYGDVYEAQRCNGMEAPGDMIVPVGELAGCRTRLAIFDLSGNVYEWEDACEAMTGATDRCQRRGGSYKSAQVNMPCEGNDSTDYTRLDATGETTGIRCCADILSQ